MWNIDKGAIKFDLDRYLMIEYSVPVPLLTLSFRSKSPDVLFEAIKECESIENQCPLDDQTISAILKSPLNIS